MQDAVEQHAPMATRFSVPRGTMISSHESITIGQFIELIVLTGNNTLPFDMTMKVGFNKSEPLLDTAFDIPSTFSYISDHYWFQPSNGNC